MQDWFAPNLAGDLRSGLGELERGRHRRVPQDRPQCQDRGLRADGRGDHQFDLEAQRCRPEGDRDLSQGHARSPPRRRSPASPTRSWSQAGEAIYLDNCSACHRSNGEGSPGTFPPLKGDATVQDRDPTTVVRVILDGVHAVATDARPTPLAMPSFKWKLSNEEVAAVASYVRSTWGNAAPAISASDVQSMRQVLDSAKK